MVSNDTEDGVGVGLGPEGGEQCPFKLQFHGDIEGGVLGPAGRRRERRGEVRVTELAHLVAGRLRGPMGNDENRGGTKNEAIGREAR